jgi:hypothetical protein
VLGIHTKITILEPGMTCQAPYLLVKSTITIGLILYIYIQDVDSHMSDHGLKECLLIQLEPMSETAYFVRVFGITPSLEGHQVFYQVYKCSDVETCSSYWSFGILPFVEVRQKQVRTLHNTTYFTVTIWKNDRDHYEHGSLEEDSRGYINLIIPAKWCTCCHMFSKINKTLTVTQRTVSCTKTKKDTVRLNLS